MKKKVTIAGRVISTKDCGYEAGNTYGSFIIEDKNNMKFNVDMNKNRVIPFDATGSGGASVSKGNLIKVFYWGSNKTGHKTVNAVKVYINQIHQYQ